MPPEPELVAGLRQGAVRRAEEMPGNRANLGDEIVGTDGKGAMDSMGAPPTRDGAAVSPNIRVVLSVRLSVTILEAVRMGDPSGLFHVGSDGVAAGSGLSRLGRPRGLRTVRGGAGNRTRAAPRRSMAHRSKSGAG